MSRYFSTAKERDAARHKGVPLTKRAVVAKAKRDAKAKRVKRRLMKTAA